MLLYKILKNPILFQNAAIPLAYKDQIENHTKLGGGVGGGESCVDFTKQLKVVKGNHVTRIS